MLAGVHVSMDAVSGLQAIHMWHADVHQDYIVLLGVHSLQEPVAVYQDNICFASLPIAADVTSIILARSTAPKHAFDLCLYIQKH